MEVETWKPIPGAEDYNASSLGRIRRASPDSCGRVPKILAQAVKSTGRLQVSICRSKQIKAEHVHRLVALAFHGEPPEGKPFCCHRDGNPRNNRPENLYWGNARDNAVDAMRHGTTQIGTRNINAKLNEDAVRIIRRDARSSTVIAREYGINPATVCSIRRGNTWRHVT